MWDKEPLLKHICEKTEWEIERKIEEKIEQTLKWQIEKVKNQEETATKFITENVKNCLNLKDIYKKKYTKSSIRTPEVN